MSLPTSSSSLLLFVLVKSAKIQVSEDEFYSYVVLKIDNVKSITSVVKGQQPTWEQEFYFDVPDRSAGLQIELWERGQLWDKLLGLCHISLNDDDHDHIQNPKINLNNVNERWINLDSELILNRQGEKCRTCNPTGHSLLIHIYIQFPSDLTEEESRELTEKLQILQEILNKKGKQLQDVTFDEINSLSKIHLDQQGSLDDQQLTHHSHSHFYDDIDYTSDISYPINRQSNLNNLLLSMSQSNIVPSPNQNHSPSISTRKPLAFVQPVMRDFPSLSNSPRRLNQNQIEKTPSLTQEESRSYINQSRKFSMKKLTNTNSDEKNRNIIDSGNKTSY